MLLRVVFLIAMLTVLVQAIVFGSVVLARATIARRTAAIASAATLDATTQAQSLLASAIASNGGPLALPSLAPSPSSTCALAASDASCALAVTTSVRFITPQVTPVASPSPCPAAQCTTYWQANQYVAEGRIDAQVSAVVIDGRNALLARRDVLLRFRDIAVAPYAILAGSVDLRGTLPSDSVGDDAGNLGAVNGGTLVDVVYRNASSAIETPANVWIPHGPSLAGTATAWDP